MNKPFAAAFAAIVLLWGAMAHAKLPERPTGPVYDGASIIPDDVEAGIDAKLRALSKDTGKTLIVATVPSLDGQEVEEYAVELFETWGIGDAEKDEGALILVAPNERRTRIEVGLGSEGIMPDALAGRIIEQQVIPQFKAGNYGGGIAAAADAVSEQLRREPTDAKAAAAAAERAERQGSNEDEGGEISMVFFWLFIFFFLILPVIRSFFSGGKKYRGKRRDDDDDDDDDHWGGPVIIWGGGGSSGSSWGGGGGFSSGGGGFGGFGGGMSGGGGASGGW